MYSEYLRYGKRAPLVGVGEAARDEGAEAVHPHREAGDVLDVVLQQDVVDPVEGSTVFLVRSTLAAFSSASAEASSGACVNTKFAKPTYARLPKWRRVRLFGHEDHFKRPLNRLPKMLYGKKEAFVGSKVKHLIAEKEKREKLLSRLNE